MELDLVIAGGLVMDGSGRPGFHADIGIRDGRIVEIGEIAAAAARTIDAAGALVTPGFIDMHTHYDAQAIWDSDLEASSRNGVTTVIMGNCGVGCAPRMPGNDALLTALLAGVEDIPASVLDVALDWRWTSFGSFLDRLAERPHAINIGAYVCHAPIRICAMGERAIDGSRATARDVAMMQRLLRDALDDGALGFSSGRIGGHQMDGGGRTPDFHADRDELLALATTVAQSPGRVIQFASDFGLRRGDDVTCSELALLGAVAATGAPVLAPLHQWPEIDGGWRRIAGHIAQLREDGADIRLEVSARAIGMLMGLELTVHPFVRHPAFAGIAGLPLAQRLEHLRDAEMRARLLSERPEPLGVDDAMMQMVAHMDAQAHRIFPCDGAPDFEPDAACSVAAIAARSGKSVMSVFLDALCADEGRRLLYFPFFNFDGANLDEQRAMLALPTALFGFGDAGAHASQICDAAYSSFNLAHWGRDRAVGLPLERIVYQMTGGQADLFGLADRGRVAVGARADINVIDHAALTLEPPELRHDLPGGGRRLLQTARGYIATFVDGIAIVEHDRLTGARPGQVLRAA